MNKPTKTEEDFDSIPDEIFLKPDHEGLLPELKPIRTNTLAKRKSATIAEKAALLGTLGALVNANTSITANGGFPTISVLAERQRWSDALKAKVAKENKEAEERALWNKKIEDERRDKQTRKKLKKIKAKGSSFADND